MALVSIFVGSVQGTAHSIALNAQSIIQQAGHDAKLHPCPELTDIQNDETDVILVITSTTGQGELPPDMAVFYHQCQDAFPLLNQKPFAVLGLGDSSFDDFCQASRLMDELLEELQGKRMCERLEIDAAEHFDPEPVAQAWLENWVKLI